MQTRLKIAIQKSGRLNEDSVRVLKEAGISFNNGLNQLKTEAVNFPLEIFFLRDDDIPQYVNDGVADIGIAGENIILEKNKPIKTIERLGFGKCRLSIAIPREQEYKGLQDLQGKRIATSYTTLLSKFLEQQNVSADIHEISGSVEIAPGIGLADAVCDLVSSGSTLFSNGLKEAEVILRSEALLVGNPTLTADKKMILENLVFRLNAAKKAKNNKYILLNAPNQQLDEICAILPGMKSPTVVPLATKGWSSVHSVIEENQFWEVIEKLKAKGAQGILVMPIEKMIV